MQHADATRSSPLKSPKDKIGVSLSDKISFKKTGAQCVEKERGLSLVGWVSK